MTPILRSRTAALLVVACSLLGGCFGEPESIPPPEASPPPGAGDAVPSFRVEFLLPAGGKSVLDSESLRSPPGEPWLVLAFMDRAESPDSTRELESLRDVTYWLSELDVRICAVTADGPGTLREVAERLRLRFPLISDPEGEFAARFGARRDTEPGIRPMTVGIRCFRHESWLAFVDREVDVHEHGSDLVRRIERRYRSRVHHRLSPGDRIMDHEYQQGSLRVTILGPGRLREQPDLIRSGHPPILFEGQQVESLAGLRWSLLQTCDPRRYPARLEFDGMTPRTPIPTPDGSPLYPSERPLRVDCEWDQVFGWTQAVIHCATRLPGESLESVVRESPLVLQMDWGTMRSPSLFCLWRLPMPNGFPDPTAHHSAPRRLSLIVPPGPRAEYPPDRRVALYVDDDELPMGYCNGLRLVPSQQGLPFWDLEDFRDVEMELDPPDLLKRIDARLRDSPRDGLVQVELLCSPDICHGLVDELISRLMSLSFGEVSLRTPPSLFAELEAGRIR